MRVVRKFWSVEPAEVFTNKVVAPPPTPAKVKVMTGGTDVAGGLTPNPK